MTTTLEDLIRNEGKETLDYGRSHGSASLIGKGTMIRDMASWCSDLDPVLLERANAAAALDGADDMVREWCDFIDSPRAIAERLIEWAEDEDD
jgi:hypothetical protein